MFRSWRISTQHAKSGAYFRFIYKIKSSQLIDHHLHYNCILITYIMIKPSMQLVNHGLESSLLEKLKREIEEFYALPLEERLKYRIRSGEFEGYGQLLFQNSGDQKVDWADRLYMITNPISRRKPHLFPELPTSLRSSSLRLFSFFLVFYFIMWLGAESEIFYGILIWRF